jgi:uncharacterized membrane protein (DUF4010 family)
MADLALWQSMGVALAIGLLVGAERERSKPGGGSPGIRSFALVALAGALATVLEPVIAAGVAAGVLLLLVAAYIASHHDDPGVTSEIAAVVTFGLGALTTTRPALAAGAAVAMTVLLVSRGALHRFVQETVTEREQVDALKFFVAAFVLLPVLPSGSYGPYDTWVPQRIWLLVVVITGIGWFGYVAVRVLGQSRGLLVAGLAGGFVSGTATTGVMAARARRGEATRSDALAGALLASLATLVQLVVVTTIAEPRVAARLLPVMALGATVLVAEVGWLVGRGRRGDPGSTAAPGSDDRSTGRPFALGPALILAGIISAVLPLAIWLEHRYGAAGSVTATAAGALGDVHGASVAVATLAHSGRISVDTAVLAVFAGLATNTVGKLAVALAAGGWRFALGLLGWFAPVAVSVALAALLR